MLISDMDRFEILSETEAVVGGKNLQLSLTDDSDDSLLITLGLDNQPLLSKRLSNGKSLNYNFSNGVSGSLTAQRQKNGKHLIQSVSLVGKTQDGVNFSFSSNYTANVL